MTNVVTIAKALADTTRWRIVRMVMDEPLCVCELADILDMPQSSVSSHVQIIRKARLLESEKCEKWTYFRVEARYLKAIRALEATSETGADEAWSADFSRMTSRLEQRDESCCPGPKHLRSRRTTTRSTAKP